MPISSQRGLPINFLQPFSLLQVKQASQKDNCKSCILAFAEKSHRIWAQIAQKLKLLTFRTCCFFFKDWREPVREVNYRKKSGVMVHLRGLTTFVDITILTYHCCVCLYFFLSARAWCLRWREIETRIVCTVRMCINHLIARTSLRENMWLLFYWRKK